MLGAGSFGIVRVAVDRETGRRYACKTVPKIPKQGKPTPRYLLKLQQEVDAMQQLGGSFDAVYLRVSPPPPPTHTGAPPDPQMCSTCGADAGTPESWLVAMWPNNAPITFCA